MAEPVISCTAGRRFQAAISGPAGLTARLPVQRNEAPYQGPLTKPQCHIDSCSDSTPNLIPPKLPILLLEYFSVCQNLALRGSGCMRSHVYHTLYGVAPPVHRTLQPGLWFLVNHMVIIADESQIAYDGFLVAGFALSRGLRELWENWERIETDESCTVTPWLRPSRLGALPLPSATYIQNFTSFPWYDFPIKSPSFCLLISVWEVWIWNCMGPHFLGSSLSVPISDSGLHVF